MLFLLRKESCGNPFMIESLTDLFHIHSQLPSQCEGQQDDVTRMGNVELNVVPHVTAAQGWLPLVGIAEHEFRRIRINIAA